MADKILDCSHLSDKTFEKTRNGLDLMHLCALTGKKAYFGCVIKEDMKAMTKYFKYTDKKTLSKGVVLGAGLMWVGGKIKKNFNEYKELFIQGFRSGFKGEGSE